MRPRPVFSGVLWVVTSRCAPTPINYWIVKYDRRTLLLLKPENPALEGGGYTPGFMENLVVYCIFGYNGLVGSEL